MIWRYLKIIYFYFMWTDGLSACKFMDQKLKEGVESLEWELDRLFWVAVCWCSKYFNRWAFSPAPQLFFFSPENDTT